MVRLVAVGVLSLAVPLAAQSALTEDQEIRLARSAAPAAVSEHATVLVLEKGKYRTAVHGTNEVTCIVGRSRAESLEPICYDREASRTMLPMLIRRVEMRLAGATMEAIDAEIEAGIGRGELVVPTRPAMGYMVSSGQRLVAPDGRKVGEWYPHLMIYIPYLTADEMGLYGAPSMAAAAVFDEGLPTAHLVIAVREFVDP